eukprot:jgi/Picsp_1/60/NSC_00060-R1_box-like protein
MVLPVVSLERFPRAGGVALSFGALQREKQVQRAVGDRNDVDICGDEAAYSFSSWSKCGWWASSLVSSAGVETPRRREKVVMPLIHPIFHGTPFAVGIEMLGHTHHERLRAAPQVDGGVQEAPLARNGTGGSETVSGRTRRDWLEDTHDSDEERMYELRFVLDGKGFLCQVGSQGCYEKVDDLQPGDAIACTPGVATVEEGAFSDRIVTMVVYVPKLLVEDIDDTINLGKAVNIASRFVENVWKEKRHFGYVSDILSEEDMLSVLRGSGAAVGNNSVVDGGGRVEGRQNNDDIDDATVILHPEGGDGDVGSSLQSLEEYNMRIEKDDAFPIVKMRLSDVSTFMLPGQTNRLALMFDPLSQIPFPFVVGVEIFEPGHRTNPHIHSSAYEMFFILSGQGEGFCNNERFPVRPGDIIVFHPGSTHGIDNGNDERMYCVEIMLPDQNFAEFVRAGQLKDLHLDDLCILARIGCN